jgi:hypothetical protein
MTVFEKYSNVNADGTAEANTSTTGKIYFSLNGATATNVSITVAGATVQRSNTNGSANITGGSLTGAAWPTTPVGSSPGRPHSMWALRITPLTLTVTFTPLRLW